METSAFDTLEMAIGLLGGNLGFGMHDFLGQDVKGLLNGTTFLGQFTVAAEGHDNQVFFIDLIFNDATGEKFGPTAQQPFVQPAFAACLLQQKIALFFPVFHHFLTKIA